MYTRLLEPDQISHTQTMIAERRRTNRVNVYTLYKSVSCHSILSLLSEKLLVLHSFIHQLYLHISVFTQGGPFKREVARLADFINHLTHPLVYSAFCHRIVRPFKFARLKGFERLENCLTKGTYERF